MFLKSHEGCEHESVMRKNLNSTGYRQYMLLLSKDKETPLIFVNAGRCNARTASLAKRGNFSSNCEGYFGTNIHLTQINTGVDYCSSRK